MPTTGWGPLKYKSKLFHGHSYKRILSSQGLHVIINCIQRESSFALWNACVNGAVFIYINFTITRFTPTVSLKLLGGVAPAKYGVSS